MKKLLLIFIAINGIANIACEEPNKLSEEEKVMLELQKKQLKEAKKEAEKAYNKYCDSYKKISPTDDNYAKYKKRTPTDDDYDWVIAYSIADVRSPKKAAEYCPAHCKRLTELLNTIEPLETMEKLLKTTKVPFNPAEFLNKMKKEGKVYTWDGVTNKDNRVSPSDSSRSYCICKVPKSSK